MSNTKVDMKPLALDLGQFAPIYKVVIQLTNVWLYIFGKPFTELCFCVHAFNLITKHKITISNKPLSQ